MLLVQEFQFLHFFNLCTQLSLCPLKHFNQKRLIWRKKIKLLMRRNEWMNAFNFKHELTFGNVEQYNILISKLNVYFILNHRASFCSLVIVTHSLFRKHLFHFCKTRKNVAIFFHQVFRVWYMLPSPTTTYNVSRDSFMFHLLTLGLRNMKQFKDNIFPTSKLISNKSLTTNLRSWQFTQV